MCVGVEERLVYYRTFLHICLYKGVSHYKYFRQVAGNTVRKYYIAP